MSPSAMLYTPASIHCSAFQVPQLILMLFAEQMLCVGRLFFPLIMSPLRERSERQRSHRRASLLSTFAAVGNGGRRAAVRACAK